MELQDRLRYKTQWLIRRFADDEAFRSNRPTPVIDADTGKELPAVSVIEGNMLLNEGIQSVLDTIGGIGSTTLYNNANARLGVGDSATAEAAGQTDLQASSNKTYKAMDPAYPQRAAQTLTFRGIFGSADANYAWQEFVVDNGAAAGKTLNRKVSAQGTKAGGQTWTLDVAITLS